MHIHIYTVNAFSKNISGGNPACVVPLEQWIDDEIMLEIAKENAVTETAFFVQNEDGFDLRWFTPEFEIDLCGHGTLATAHILYTSLGYDQKNITFYTQSGIMEVKIIGDMYELNFPSRIPLISELPQEINRALNIKPIHILKSRDYILIYNNEQEIRNLSIDKKIFDTINIDPGGVVCTAPGDNCDFVSRYFISQSSIMEDPVTGSSHCSLVPYWQTILGKDIFTARQLSERGGTLFCKIQGDRILIRGSAILVYDTGKDIPSLTPLSPSLLPEFAP